MKKGYLAASLVLAAAVASGGASMSANAAISTKIEEVAVFNGDASAPKKVAEQAEAPVETPEVTSATAQDKDTATNVVTKKATKVYKKAAKVTISAANAKKADANGDFVVNFTNSAKETIATVTANAADLSVDSTVKVFAVNNKTGAVSLVNSKTYTVTAKGNLVMVLPQSSDVTYTVVNTDDAATIAADIEATVVLTKSKKTLSVGDTYKVAFKKAVDKTNFKLVTYGTSKKSVVTVDKNGKITAVKAGTANIKVTVTLKNTAKVVKRIAVTVK
ncbi:MAG: Ig-like domain-containing protein [Lachnospiraceae bacterium]|nr:Ig-like domain-containing protein [Lachnospiraceae bacterium]